MAVFEQGYSTYAFSLMTWCGVTPSIARMKRGTQKKKRNTTRITFREGLRKYVRFHRAGKGATHIEFMEGGQAYDYFGVSSSRSLDEMNEHIRLDYNMELTTRFTKPGNTHLEWGEKSQSMSFYQTGRTHKVCNEMRVMSKSTEDPTKNM